MFKTLSTLSLCASLALALNIQELDGFASPESVYATKDAIYVSNLGKEVKPLEKDGDGFILKLSIDGKVLEKIENLDAPKGMGIIDGVLYVTDIDTLKGFDLKSKKQVFTLKIDGAIFLNDITTQGKNTLYISDTGSGKIHKINLKQKSYQDFITLESSKYGGGPNGLMIEGNTLWVATYDPAQKAEGQVLKINLKNKKISQFSDAKGFMDGITKDKRGNLLVSAWGNNLEGVVYQINSDGKSSKLPIRPIKGCADIFYHDGVLWIPAMIENKILKITQ
ncbi:ATP-binding protein [Helicobacter pametensis]|uniref:ATP-binding protein n=1 Tax=Helicobacter pametensis TaxID=95149 RepID=UPI0004875445|nr:ATP-binding protein [Helicobacter pametensis]